MRVLVREQSLGSNKSHCRKYEQDDAYDDQSENLVLC